MIINCLKSINPSNFVGRVNSKKEGITSFNCKEYIETNSILTSLISADGEATIGSSSFRWWSKYWE
ncbi:hypothetical protein PPL_02561 [Heterostelium album PN500]|uniref:Uncharacterized protein n=1 Tax=Heterostelium pallidum (strain ATCC 26659 / Pp 5 / PN500) TaxID=670386 RepID=D3B2F0_HETP5|nr:hypothetical protein PPL_02561 [Heterostelium album PN500]EFA84525.1 hypothetical protein PPL_02561 [Heterostelium album PN500]|eukprot:XP_020436638.1 hypothetical protein PPL_02561 [Heterostelium album PN500]